MRFIKEQHPDVEFEYPYDEDGKRITVCNLIPRKKMPPTRRARYCCQELKEYGGVGRFVITGVRWAESAKRKNMRNLAEEHTKSGKRRMSTDNVSDAPMFKFCYDYHKKILNPIIDWANEEVWEFIKDYNVPYCELYDRGFKRIGCIGCPMSTKAKQELDAYPKIKKRYLIAFDRMLEVRREEGLKTTWKTPEEVMEWWLKR